MKRLFAVAGAMLAAAVALGEEAVPDGGERGVWGGVLCRGLLHDQGDRRERRPF